MCGPSKQEMAISNSQQKFMTTLQGNYATNFAKQQSVLDHLNATLSPIISKGPNQTGFSAEERAALNSRAIDSTAGNYANAAKALNTQTAGRNDSGNLPESGVDRALKARLASRAAGDLSNEQLGIVEADYATGRSNFNNAVGAQEGVASQFNPVSTANAANSANQNAFQEANTVNQESNQADADLYGGIASLAGAGLSFITGGMGAGAGSFLSKGIGALAGR